MARWWSTPAPSSLAPSSTPPRPRSSEAAMRARENYTPHLAVAFGLTLAILAAFQLYLLREPGRIAGVLAADKNTAVAAGAALFDKNCSPCHGSQGEGDIGPALNDKLFLSSTADDTIFSVISSGVPDTQMPAWNQSHGGPLTDQDVNNLVAFIRSWEPNAPNRRSAALVGNPARGAKIFSSVCFICHGQNGAGTSTAPALNDPVLLAQFDDTWFKSTISAGRPAQGMPTWGTVLSPQQITDLLALIDQWRTQASVVAPTQVGGSTQVAGVTPTPPAATPAAGTPAAGTPAAGTPTGGTPAATEAAPEIARPSNPGGPGGALNLTGNATTGQEVFVTNCQKCHGPQGTGAVNNPGSDDGTVPPLNPIDSTLANSDPAVFAFNMDLFIEHGSTPSGSSPQLTMPAWGDQKKLTDQQIADVMAYVISLNVPAGATPTPNGPEIARPSNPGGPGTALDLTGDPAKGADVFVTDCQKCHGPQGTAGVKNPGSDDGTVPALNPIDSTLSSGDALSFAYNVDLFVEHGSTPSGTAPQISMPAWGDQKKLTPQQIADVIAYVMSLNPAVPVTTTAAAPTAAVTVTVTATQAAATQATATPTSAATSAGPTPTGGTPAATQAAPQIARPSNPGGPGQALNLTGNPTTGQSLFATNCVKCHGPQGTGGVNNPGSDDGTVPVLNPIDSTIANGDPAVFAFNLDLFIEHGSTPNGSSPQLTMPAWGDQNKLTPQQIADIMAYVIQLNQPGPGTPTPNAPDIARPSNPGGPGGALNLTGNPTTGQAVFATSCVKCHGPQGTGGVSNPGSDDGTVPPLNPIDSTLSSGDALSFAYNVDLFVEHGSTPSGSSPQLTMPAWGDQKKLTDQQIADVIAYVMSLNKQ